MGTGLVRKLKRLDFAMWNTKGISAQVHRPQPD
jgi:hypothetical protein